MEQNINLCSHGKVDFYVDHCTEMKLASEGLK